MWPNKMPMKYLRSIQKHFCVSFYLLGTPPRTANSLVWERFPNHSASKQGWKQMSKESCKHWASTRRPNFTIILSHHCFQGLSEIQLLHLTSLNWPHFLPQVCPSLVWTGLRLWHSQQQGCLQLSCTLHEITLPFVVYKPKCPCSIWYPSTSDWKGQWAVMSYSHCLCHLYHSLSELFFPRQMSPSILKLLHKMLFHSPLSPCALLLSTSQNLYFWILTQFKSH